MNRNVRNELKSKSKKIKFVFMPALKIVPLSFDDPYRQELFDLLNEYNSSFGLDTATIDLFLFAAKNKKGKTVGGVQGCIQSKWLTVFTLYSSKEEKGIGTKLMERVEKYAKEKGCKGIQLSTLTFQAPDFYRKLGYEVCGAVENYCGNYTNFYLKKEF